MQKKLKIKINDIDLSKYKTNGSDYDAFLVDHGLTMIDRYKKCLAQDEDEETELTDAEVQRLVQGDTAKWK